MVTPLQSARLERKPWIFHVELDHIVAVLSALGHRLRLELWRLLVPRGTGGLSAGCIATQLGVAPSSLSFHLQQMTQAGILVQRRSSRQIIYAVNAEVVASVCFFLANQDADELVSLPAVLPSDDAIC